MSGKGRRWTAVAGMLAALAFCAGAQFDMYKESDKIFRWQKPDPYPSTILDQLDDQTLSALLDAGNLQWYEPRPEEGRFNTVVGMKVHAPIDTFWKVLTDYEGTCRIMNKTFVSCKTESRQGNTVKNVYKLRTTVLEYASTFDMVDVVTEEPPRHQQIRTIEGGLKGREVDLYLRPADNGQSTIAFMRYYANMPSLGISMRAVLAVVPMSEWPVTAASANYHLRAHRNEAERIAGFTRPDRPAELDFARLTPPTLEALSKYRAGLIRETAAGKDINGLTWDFINAPAETVYALLADLDHYNDYFPNQETKVKSRQGAAIEVWQKTSSQSVLVFTFGYEMDATYQLDPPAHVSYLAKGGTYDGSMGDFRVVPIGAARSILFSTIGINFDKDDAITARIIRSGDYPFSTVMNLIAARTYLNAIKPAAEAKTKAAPKAP